jgi:translation initiation factor IF-3
VGRRIRVPEVRVIGADGAQIGVIPTHEALKLAEEAGFELVEVNPRAAPPVCKIMDFGKFKYETSKKEKASRKHQTTVVLKEIKLRPKTDEHDFDFKVKHIRRFLGEGNKCKLVIVFRGREIVHPETGQAMLDSVVKTVGDVAMVEQRPMMEGRRMVMIIGPRGGVIRPPSSPPISGGGPGPSRPPTSAPTGAPPSAAPAGAPPSAAATPSGAAKGAAPVPASAPSAAVPPGTAPAGAPASAAAKVPPTPSTPAAQAAAGKA